MKVKYKQVTFILIFVMVLNMSIIPKGEAQEPSLRELRVEGMTNTEIEWGIDEKGEIIYLPCLEINFTFALTNVDKWADQCKYLLWKGKQSQSIIGNWSVGFSARDPPRLQGIYGGEGFLTFFVLMAEFPYSTATIDGQLYYRYRIHVYVNETLVGKETLFFGGDYEAWPTLQGSSLERLKVKKVRGDGVVTFKSKRLHDAD